MGPTSLAVLSRQPSNSDHKDQKKWRPSGRFFIGIKKGAFAPLEEIKMVSPAVLALSNRNTNIFLLCLFL